MTKGLHEYEVYKNELRICLLRSIGTISNPKNPARKIPAGPDLKIPEAQCLKESKAEFAISFQNPKETLYQFDEFSENYVVFDGKTDKKFTVIFDKIPNNTYIYGINKDKKISYNVKNKKIELI